MPPPPPSCASSFPSRNHHHTDITIRSNHNNLSGNIPTTSSGAPFLRQLQRSVEGAGPAFADRGLRCSRVFSKSSFQGCWASSCYCGEGILVLRAWALFPESELSLVHVSVLCITSYQEASHPWLCCSHLVSGLNPGFCTFQADLTRNGALLDPSAFGRSSFQNHAKCLQKCAVRIFSKKPEISGNGSFRKLGVPYFGVLVIRILLFRVLHEGPLFSETP